MRILFVSYVITHHILSHDITAHSCINVTITISPLLLIVLVILVDRSVSPQKRTTNQNLHWPHSPVQTPILFEVRSVPK